MSLKNVFVDLTAANIAGKLDKTKTNKVVVKYASYKQLTDYPVIIPDVKTRLEEAVKGTWEITQNDKNFTCKRI